MKYALKVVWDDGKEEFFHETDGTPALFDHKAAAEMYRDSALAGMTAFRGLNVVMRCNSIKVIQYP